MMNRQTYRWRDMKRVQPYPTNTVYINTVTNTYIKLTIHWRLVNPIKCTWLQRARGREVKKGCTNCHFTLCFIGCPYKCVVCILQQQKSMSYYVKRDFHNISLVGFISRTLYKAAICIFRPCKENHSNALNYVKQHLTG